MEVTISSDHSRACIVHHCVRYTNDRQSKATVSSSLTRTTQTLQHPGDSLRKNSTGLCRLILQANESRNSPFQFRSWCPSFCCLSLRESVNDTTPGSKRSFLLPPFTQNYANDHIEDQPKPAKEDKGNDNNIHVHNSRQLCITFDS